MKEESWGEKVKKERVEEEKVEGRERKVERGNIKRDVRWDIIFEWSGNIKYIEVLDGVKVLDCIEIYIKEM